MNKLLLLALLLVPAFAFADAGETGFFQPLWDLIDLIYKWAEDIKNSIVGFLIEIVKVGFLWWLKIKLNVLIFVWSVIEPIIDSLNLGDVIATAFGSLRQDWQAFIIQMRIGEGINILLSARVTRAVLDFIRW